MEEPMTYTEREQSEQITRHEGEDQASFGLRASKHYLAMAMRATALDSKAYKAMYEADQKLRSITLPKR